MPKLTPQDEFANQLAEDFGEPEEVALFRAMFKRYSEALLRRAHAEVMSIPAERIRKSKAAIFFYLVRKFARKEREGASAQPNELMTRAVDADPDGKGVALPTVPRPPTPPT